MTSTTSPLKINSLVVRSGMAIIDSRDNFHAEKESDIKTESIIDPAQIKFYEAFQSQIEAAVAAGKKTIPAMFRCQMYVPDADGNITLKEVSFTMLGQKSITTLGNLMEKLKAPGAKKTRAGAGEGGAGEGGAAGDQNAAGEGGAAGGEPTTPVVDDAAVKAAAEAEAAAAAAAKAKAGADAKAKADAEAKKAVEEQAAAAAKTAADEAAKAKAAQDAAVAVTAAALPVASAAEEAVAATMVVAADADAAVVDSLFAED